MLTEKWEMFDSRSGKCVICIKQTVNEVMTEQTRQLIAIVLDSQNTLDRIGCWIVSQRSVKKVWAEKDLFTATADMIPTKGQSRISVVVVVKELGQCQATSSCSIPYYSHGFEWGTTSVDSCFNPIKGVQTIVVCGPTEHMKRFLIDPIQSLLPLLTLPPWSLLPLWRNETTLRRHTWTWRSHLSIHRQESRTACESCRTPEGCWSLVRPHHYQLLNTVPWRESENCMS